jgi:ribosome-binding ATPase YchF (GTP1/OBG family)
MCFVVSISQFASCGRFIDRSEIWKLFEFELQVKDLEQIEKKISKVEKAAKVGEKRPKKHWKFY